MSDTILETEGLTREFGGFVAVDGVALKVRAGSIHALIGPNSAGKTTCFNMLTKFLAPTRGTIHFKGRDITRFEAGAGGAAGPGAQLSDLGGVSAFDRAGERALALQRARGASFDFWRSEKVLSVFNDRAHELLFDVGLSEMSTRWSSSCRMGASGRWRSRQRWRWIRR